MASQLRSRLLRLQMLGSGLAGALFTQRAPLRTRPHAHRERELDFRAQVRIVVELRAGSRELAASRFERKRATALILPVALAMPRAEIRSGQICSRCTLSVSGFCALSY